MCNSPDSDRSMSHTVGGELARSISPFVKALLNNNGWSGYGKVNKLTYLHCVNNRGERGKEATVLE